MVPGVTIEQATQGMEDHIDLTLSIIEAYGRGDTEKRLFQMSQASAQAFQFANVIADGIEKRR